MNSEIQQPKKSTNSGNGGLIAKVGTAIAILLIASLVSTY